MGTATIGVLLVEDFRPYRVFVRSLLAKSPDFQVISEASDGLEAVEKTQHLKPDLVLMDIGLPILNGLDAARRIGNLVPSSKIVFLTLETDIDVVQEAYRSGARGYVAKQQARTELLAVLAAVLQGKPFATSTQVSGGFDAHTGNRVDPFNRRPARL